MLTRQELRFRLYTLAMDGILLMNMPLLKGGMAWITEDLNLIAWEAREIRRALWTWLR